MAKVTRRDVIHMMMILIFLTLGYGVDFTLAKVLAWILIVIDATLLSFTWVLTIISPDNVKQNVGKALIEKRGHIRTINSTLDVIFKSILTLLAIYFGSLPLSIMLIVSLACEEHRVALIQKALNKI